MHYGLLALGRLFGFGGTPSQQELNQQVAQGSGSDTARDRLAKDERRRRALKVVGRRQVHKRVNESIGVGRVAASRKGSRS